MQLAALDRSIVLPAPERLVAETRVDFRCAALDSVGRVGGNGAGGGALTIDLSSTRDLDASGLGILVLVQKKAKEQGVATKLAGVSERIKNLLVLTKLELLFEFVD
jgi:anti-anti-sigma regulatory factor